MSLGPPFSTFTAPKRIYFGARSREACILDPPPIIDIPIIPISLPRRHLRPSRRQLLLSRSSAAALSDSVVFEGVVQLPSPGSALFADPQPFYAGSWARSDKISCPTTIEPRTPNEKDCWNSRPPAPSGADWHSTGGCRPRMARWHSSSRARRMRIKHRGPRMVQMASQDHSRLYRAQMAD